MRGLIGWVLAACFAAGLVAPVAGQVPATRVDVVQAAEGVCRYRYVLEPGETRVVYCDLADSGLRKFLAVVETGSYDVPGWVSDTFLAPAGVMVVLRNDAAFRRRGNAWMRTVARP
jgi:hypothetical protein